MADLPGLAKPDLAGHELAFACPYCGETNELFIDPGESGQTLTADCRVCCQPIEISLPLWPDQTPLIRAENG